MFRKTFKIGENALTWTEMYSLEGTNKYILKLVGYGYAYNSRFILLKSSLTIERLNKNEEKVLALIRNGGSGLGKIIKDDQLKYNDAEQCIYIDVE